MTTDAEIAERFSIERSYRPAERGPNPKVADGWTVADLVLGTRRWTATKAEAEQAAADQLGREANVRTSAAGAICWWTTSGSPACELWLQLGRESAGDRIYAGLVSSGPDRAERIRALLDLVGLGELPEEGWE